MLSSEIGFLGFVFNFSLFLWLFQFLFHFVSSPASGEKNLHTLKEILDKNS